MLRISSYAEEWMNHSDYTLRRGWFESTLTFLSDKVVCRSWGEMCYNFSQLDGEEYFNEKKDFLDSSFTNGFDIGWMQIRRPGAG